MLINRLEPESQPELDRIYIASAVLANFRGHKDVEVQLFRSEYPDSELNKLLGKNLVSNQDPSIPPEVLAGASEESALRCLLEGFTKTECEQLENYLKERYADQITRLDFAPLPLPLPLGLGPLGELPQGETSGFINFYKAPGYNLPFKVKGWYDLDQHEHEHQ